MTPREVSRTVLVLDDARWLRAFVRGSKDATAEVHPWLRRGDALVLENWDGSLTAYFPPGEPGNES